MWNKTLSIGLLVAAPLLVAAGSSQAGEGHPHDGDQAHADSASHAGHENKAPETQSYYKEENSEKADAAADETPEHSHEGEDGSHTH